MATCSAVVRCIVIHFILLVIAADRLCSAATAQTGQDAGVRLHEAIAGEEFNVFLPLEGAIADDARRFNMLLIEHSRGIKAVRAVLIGSTGGTLTFFELKELASGPSGLRDVLRTAPAKSGLIQSMFVSETPFDAASSPPQVLCLTLRAAFSGDALRTEPLALALAAVANEKSEKPSTAPRSDNAATAELTTAIYPFGEFYFEVRRKPQTGNLAASFSAEQKAVVTLPSAEAATLSLQKNFTLEFWMRTVALQGAVFSSWSGAERDAYPLEVEAEPDGRLAAFTAGRFAYKKISSRSIVADGRWHLVTFTHSAAPGQLPGQLKFYLDGRLQDSCETQAADAAKSVPTLGSRAGKEKFFQGFIDDFKLFSRTKTSAELSAPKSYDSDDDPSLVIYDHFNDHPGAALRGESGSREKPDRAGLISTGLSREASSLLMAAKVRNFRTQINGRSVRLGWEFEGRSDVESFTIERSLTGAANAATANAAGAAASAETSGEMKFESIGTVVCSESQGRYGFTDAGVGEQSSVAFYRLRKNSSAVSGRAVTYSDVVKVGLAETKLFRLYQNTPNPFNPATNIEYELFEPSPVEIAVFSMLGKEVMRLTKSMQPAGKYRFMFDAAERNLSSGIYLYRIQTNSGTETRKMILTK
ncbi:MAG: T9SS type A sorting domain-containing protein [Rhizobacter sp.]|nr:T9SS type A sorting domain-containing protein [Chlorobiales bacterium]